MGTGTDLTNGKIEDIKTEQRNRLKKVYEYLRLSGITQADLSKQLDVDESTLSHYVSDSSPHKISPSFLTKLHKKYNINPNYVYGSSDMMLDIYGKQLSNLISFTNEKWDTVFRTSTDENGNEITNRYLHFTMNKNFYDFLLDVDVAKMACEKGVSSLSDEISRLKELYDAEPDLQEFVVIPRNEFTEIVQEHAAERKQLEEVLNLMQYSDYPSND